MVEDSNGVLFREFYRPDQRRAARRRRHHQRPSGDLYAERLKEDSEGDRCRDGDRVGGSAVSFQHR